MNPLRLFLLFGFLLDGSRPLYQLLPPSVWLFGGSYKMRWLKSFQSDYPLNLCFQFESIRPALMPWHADGMALNVICIPFENVSLATVRGVSWFGVAVWKSCRTSCHAVTIDNLQAAKHHECGVASSPPVFVTVVSARHALLNSLPILTDLKTADVMLVGGLVVHALRVGVALEHWP